MKKLAKPNLKNLLALPDDVAELFNPNVDLEPSEENLNILFESLREIFVERFAKLELDKSVLRFSRLGYPDKRLWFDNQELLNYVESDKEKIFEVPSLKTSMTFLFGDVIEKILLYLFREAGHIVEGEQQEVEVDGVKGHIDAVVDGVVVDLKSAHPFFYDKLTDIGNLMANDTFGYVQQLSGYTNVITPGASAAFIPFNKGSGEFEVVVVDGNIVSDYKPAPRIEHLKKVLEQPEPPKGPCLPPQPDGKSGNMVLNDGCKFCPHKTKCCKNLRAFQYANGIKFFTKVVKVPNVPEIELD